MPMKGAKPDNSEITCDRNNTRASPGIERDLGLGERAVEVGAQTTILRPVHVAVLVHLLLLK